ncbi:hypothetical protein WJX73_000602 [Symbiochloris irregularis]|uniref:Uncharacterized protein n=1 Tax=Symbiochloris irregularis TaxID=706552 RepID=A0AAW1P3F9_9CHLO
MVFKQVGPDMAVDAAAEVKPDHIRHHLRRASSWRYIKYTGVLAASLCFGDQPEAIRKLWKALSDHGLRVVFSGEMQSAFEEKHAALPNHFIQVTYESAQSLKTAVKAAERGDVVFFPTKVKPYSQSHPDDPLGDILMPEPSVHKFLLIFSVQLPDQQHLNVFFQVPLGLFPLQRQNGRQHLDESYDIGFRSASAPCGQATKRHVAAALSRRAAVQEDAG